jgi:flagellar motor component MotA
VSGSDGWFDPVAAGEPALGVLAALLGVAQLPALAQTAQMASNACWSSGSSQHAAMC